MQTVTIPTAVVGAMRTSLRDRIGKFVFRRIGKAFTSIDDLVSVTYNTGDGLASTTRTISPLEYKHTKWTPYEEEHNLEYRYSNFTVFTETRSLRGNDPCSGQSIVCNPAQHTDIDLCSFEFVKKDDGVRGTVAPRIGDLVCMLVDPSTNHRGNLYASSWFICSEQGLRAWTMMMYENHPSYKKEDARQRVYAMSGNRLVTNTPRKRAIIYAQNSMDLNPEDAYDGYYHLRTETESTLHTCIWGAAVMMARYGEIPSTGNVPANLGDGPSMLWWDLPEGWVDEFLAKWAPSYIPEKLVIESATTPAPVDEPATAIAPVMVAEPAVASPSLHTVHVERILAEEVTAIVKITADAWADLWASPEGLAGATCRGDNWADIVEGPRAEQKQLTRNERKQIARASRKTFRGFKTNLVVAAY